MILFYVCHNKWIIFSPRTVQTIGTIKLWNQIISLFNCQIGSVATRYYTATISFRDSTYYLSSALEAICISKSAKHRTATACSKRKCKTNKRTILLWQDTAGFSKCIMFANKNYAFLRHLQNTIKTKKPVMQIRFTLSVTQTPS